MHRKVYIAGFVMLLSMAALGGNVNKRIVPINDCSRIVRVQKGCCGVVIKYQVKADCCQNHKCGCHHNKCHVNWVTKDKWYPGKWPFHVINQLFLKAD